MEGGGAGNEKRRTHDQGEKGLEPKCVRGVNRFVLVQQCFLLQKGEKGLYTKNVSNKKMKMTTKLTLFVHNE